ncbi:MAG: hypothetical protein K0S08_1601 [Gammaproteobacteria bacterium]|jgi:hypothetical protein|nr:hypothetical protein [Gammaproteobacteria bacterium]
MKGKLAISLGFILAMSLWAVMPVYAQQGGCAGAFVDSCSRVNAHRCNLSYTSVSGNYHQCEYSRIGGCEPLLSEQCTLNG